MYFKKYIIYVFQEIHVLYDSWHNQVIRETSSGLNFHIRAFSIHNSASVYVDNSGM